MSKISICILGGDLRQSYLAKYMQEQGHKITCFGTISLPKTSYIFSSDDFKSAVSGADLIIGPTPFSTKAGFLHTSPEIFVTIPLTDLGKVLMPGQILAGGAIPSDFVSLCEDNEIRVLDCMKEASFIQGNSVLTAEGLLSSLIRHTPFSLKNRKVLILGYGNCGKEIARMLQHFSMKITTLDRDEIKLLQAKEHHIATYNSILEPELLKDMDMIINTIPCPILNPDTLQKLPEKCILFDIASAPFGFDLKVAESLGLTVIRCPGIPGKMMPQTAGEMIGKVILERMLSYEL